MITEPNQKIQLGLITECLIRYARNTLHYCKSTMTNTGINIEVAVQENLSFLIQLIQKLGHAIILQVLLAALSKEQILA